jgi:hypothetical protein
MMPIGDGIRRNIAHVTQAERDRLLAAILKLDNARFFPDGVSYFDKQEDIHKNAHAAGADVHQGPAFIPWHRELCNRFEALLREVDSDLSLHYWDWTVDPRSAPDGAGGTVNLMQPSVMGGSGDPVGPPFANFESTEPGHSLIWRAVGASGANPDGTPAIPSDVNVKNAMDFVDFDSNVRGPHATAHGYIGGSLGNPHFSFHDPIVFLLHSNLDRLWAEWQTDPVHPGRLAPDTAYGGFSAAPSIFELIQPWAGDVGTGATPLRPWAPPDNMQVAKTYTDISVVTPPCYDTLPTTVRVVVAENPSMEIRFTDVPEAETAIRAAVFEVRACDELTLRVSVAPNAPFAVHYPLAGVVQVPHHPQILQIARIWFRFTAGAPGAPVAPTDVTIHCDETGQDFVFHLIANSIARPTVAVMLTLDQSGSMDWIAGIDATTKRIDVLHQAASNFIQLVQDNNGVGIVSFNQVAHPGMPVTRFAGGAVDPGRVTALAAVGAITPGGATSIGSGLQLARSTLDPVVGYDRKALVVFTDGLENTAPWISDIQPLINDRTFAIGLGTAQQVSAGALTALAHQTQGYLLLSGPLSPAIDDYFRLTKYFLQILAGVTNNDIVTDPNGYLGLRTVARIPFDLSETDIDATVIVLTDTPALRFAVETPDGKVMTPADAAAAGAIFRAAPRMQYYRFNLPLALAGAPHQVGRWHALLALDPRIGKGGSDRLAVHAVSPGSAGARYSVSTHAFSNLRMRAHIAQSSMEPGARLTVGSVLTEYGVPVNHRAIVRTLVERPDGTTTTLQLSEVEPGTFTGDTLTSVAGVYRLAVRATGATMRGQPFTREQLLSAVVVAGASTPPVSNPTRDDDTRALCELVTCLLTPDELGRWLHAQGIDTDRLRRCIELWCKRRLAQPSESELAAREGRPELSTATTSRGDISGHLVAAVADMLASFERQHAAGPLPPEKPTPPDRPRTEGKPPRS